MTKIVVGVDIGASSGRIIASSLDNGKLIIKEIHRFKNILQKKYNYESWDLDNIYDNILIGLSKLKDYEIMSIGIDTWGVDYTFSEMINGENLKVAYRDSRTDRVKESFNNVMNEEELIKRTQIQTHKFNTVYQLYAQQYESDYKIKNEKILMVPDYLNYRLTGVKANELTNMSTSGLLNYADKKLDEDILKALKLKSENFPNLLEPMQLIGKVRSEIINSYELQGELNVYSVCSHDTASSVLGSLADEKTLFLSSGTWSILGCELDEYVTSKEAFKLGYSNELGFNGTIRFLKNITGMWIIEELLKNFDGKYTVIEAVKLASEKGVKQYVFDVNDDRFTRPLNMREEIKKYFDDLNIQGPQTDAELFKSVYVSLALAYKQAIDQIELLLGKEFEYLNIIGGGCQNMYLNELIAQKTKKKLLIGPVESTVIGNIMCQYMACGIIDDRNTVRKIIAKNFLIKGEK